MTTSPLKARTWTLESHGGRPLTVNRVAQMHRQEWARETAAIREEWGWLAAGARLPHLSRIRVTATPLHADGRSPQDVAACAPAVKAAIDGLVDARVIPDDNPDHLPLVVFTPPDICGHNGLRLLVEELGP